MMKQRHRLRSTKPAFAVGLLIVASGQVGGCPLIRILFPRAGLPPCSQGTVNWNVATQGRTITLDGSGSFDPQGGTLTFEWSPLFDAPTPTPTADPAVVTFEAPGNGQFGYRLEVTNEAGLSDRCSVLVNVTGFPSPPTASDTAICQGQSTTLSATPGADGDSVEWFTDGCGTTPVAGGASPTVSPTATTTYFVRTLVSGTSIVSACVSIVVTVHPLPNTPTGVDFSFQQVGLNLTATVGPGETVDWFTGSCGGTLIGSGSPLNVSVPSSDTTYFARARNLTTGCVSAACGSVEVRPD